MNNPWNLSEREAEAMDALCTHYCNKVAADRLGVGDRAFENRLHRVKRKMKTGGRLSYVLLWDRWRRGEGGGVKT